MIMMKHPTVDVPPWSTFEDPMAGAGYSLPVSGVTSGSGEYSSYMLGEAALAALQRYLPCNDSGEDSADESDAPVDAYSCDEFRMYEFKVRRCTRGRAHDWTECPYAHPGEKARRRDPRKYHYSGAACPDFRKGSCKRGDACEYAHGVFECWLHPARYRTQPCKDGTACRRRVCFFAHTSEQLRLLPQQQQSSPKAVALTPAIESYDGSPLRQQALESYMAAKHHHHHNHPFSCSPTSTLMSPPMSPPSDSPPMTPDAAVAGAPFRRSSWPASGVNEIVASLRQLQMSKASSAPSSWSLPLTSGPVFGSPRSGVGSPAVAGAKSGFCSLPTTPTRASSIARGGRGWFDGLEGVSEEEEPVERVESGRALRAKMFERLSKDSILEKTSATSAIPAPDVAWVSELVL